MIKLKVWMIKVMDFQVDGEGSDVTAWKWHHMYINRHR